MISDHIRKPKRLRNRPTIGVLTGWQVYAGVMDSFLSHVFQGILAGAAHLEYNLMIACGAGQPYILDFGRPAWPFHSPEVDFIPVGPWNCDGLVILSPFGSKERTDFVNRLVESHYPVVVTGEFPRTAAVTVDNRGGISQAMDHLIAHGHRRIAFISGRADEFYGDTPVRYQAYLESLKRHNLEFDPQLVASGFHTLPGGRMAMEQLLERRVKFTALLGSNDLSTIGAMQTMQSAGILVPQDIAVIGFDDRIDARAQLPMLSTVHFPMFDLGYQAVSLLSQYIEGTISEPRNLCIPTHLVTRESCGCAPGVSLEGPSIPRPVLVTASPSREARSAIDGPDAVTAREISPAIIDAIMTEVKRETYQLGSQEVEHLCRRLAEAFLSSLKSGNTQVFSTTFQQILARASSQKDDLLSWHTVMSIFRDWLPALYEAAPRALSMEQAIEMLNQALFTITEVSQGQNAQQTVRQEEVSNQVGAMSASFFAAQSETEIFEELSKRLPSLGIAHAVVAYYEVEGKDPAAWCGLQVSPPGVERGPNRRRLRTLQFPVESIYPPETPFSLALLPISVPGVGEGFVALDTGNMQLCATIVQQLSAALRGIHLYRQAVEARLAAEEANRVKNRFLSWVIHELRTPLNLIYGLSDMLVQESLQTKSAKISVDREDISRIHAGSEHLIGLVRDVLDLALSELGQLKLARETLDVGEELAAAEVIGKQLALEKGLGWRMVIEGPLPKVNGDKIRLRQVLLNLINNAVKFTACGEVALKASAGAGQVMITISDTGLGIPTDEQDLIFEEFQQSERTTRRGFGGLGLGLAICKRLVEMHGGEIGVYSSGEEGKGSTFFFSLPALEAPPGEYAGLRTAGLSQKMLLLVSDLPGGRKLESHLNGKGYAVEMHLVQQDLDWLPQVVLDPPYAIVLDLGLASQSGWEVLKTLKENPSTQDVPVLFCSFEEGDDRGALLEIDYMIKPAGAEALTRALLSQGVLGRQGKTGEQSIILIVDDEPETLELHARLVQAQFPACRVILAHNGREALDQVRSHRPHLVLLDLLMPEMDGFSVLQAMQQDEMSRNIPVIVLTGQALSAEDMQRLNYGVVSVLSKGMYSASETMLHLSDAISRRRKAGTETQRIVLKAMAYIHANYPAQITRQDVADFVGLSERHLTRCFKLELGLTPMTYLNRYRILQAKNLLETERDSIAEVAEKVGFSSGGYFTRVFRDEVGVTPREYQQGRRPENMSQNRKNSSLN